jgi:hypothetical protein
MRMCQYVYSTAEFDENRRDEAVVGKVSEDKRLFIAQHLEILTNI